MGGVSVDTGGGGGRRSTNQELNLIPMIDLFVVCVLFLIMTAVWSQSARVNANAQVPGPPRTDEEMEKVEPEKMLTVEMKQDDNFTLIWKSGATVHATSNVPRKGVTVKVGADSIIRYPDLAKEVAKQWKEYGSHQADNDRKVDQAIISVDNRTPFAEIVAVIDAVYQSKRTYKGEEINALNVTFSAR